MPGKDKEGPDKVVVLKGPAGNPRSLEVARVRPSHLFPTRYQPKAWCLNILERCSLTDIVLMFFSTWHSCR